MAEQVTVANARRADADTNWDPLPAHAEPPTRTRDGAPESALIVNARQAERAAIRATIEQWSAHFRGQHYDPGAYGRGQVLAILDQRDREDGR